MNKRHRDRVAFLRVCSGVFEKDMVITNAREGQEIRAARPYRFFGGKRETIERAFPGDVVGLVNPGPVRHRRHALCRHAAAVSADPAISRRSTSASRGCATCASSSSTRRSASSKKKA